MKRSHWVIIAATEILVVVAIISYLLIRQTQLREAPDVLPAPVTSGKNAPPGSIHNLPVPTAVAVARTDLARRLGLEESAIVILEALEREWSDACLGLARPGEVCAQTITPGYAVLLLAAGKEYRYRTDLSGNTVRAE